MTEQFDDLTWEIDDTPLWFSTPDEFYEVTFNATAICENGHQIEGVASYFSREDDMSGAWLHWIDYEPCFECENMEDEDEEDDEWE